MLINRTARLATAALASVLLFAPLSARAQTTPPVNPFQAFNVPPSLFFAFMGEAGGGADPMHSSAMELLQRNDVRNEIALDLKQQNALQELRAKVQQEVQATLQTSLQDSIKALQNVPQDQQTSKIQGFMDQFASTIQTLQGDIDKRTEGILRPNQVKRLRELDLRWRGSLAMSDPKVADALKLVPDQTAKVDAAVREFMDVQQKAVFAAMSAPAAPAQNSGDAPAPPPAQQMQKRLYEAVHSKEIVKTRESMAAKLIELLTPAQRSRWTTMQGARFTFRTTDVP